jgi:hypothetical protein
MQGFVCNDDSVLKLSTLKRTCIACPSQWEGTLEDGRAIYARYRHGELSVGIGTDISEAVRSGMSDQALFTDDIGDRLDGFMDIQELKAHLRGLLEFPADLVVEHGDQPSTNANTAGKLFAQPKSD